MPKLSVWYMYANFFHFNNWEFSIWKCSVCSSSAWPRKLGERPILAKKGTFLQKGGPKISLPPIQSIFEVFFVKINLSVIFEKRYSAQQPNK